MSAFIVFAGRRIDAPEASQERFPARHAPRVRAELVALLKRESVKAVVGSAASGADLLMLEVAREFELQTRVVLPFAAERFRETSVVDCSPDWGPRFDAAIAYAESNGGVVVLAPDEGDEGNPNLDAAYARATQQILKEAEHIAQATGDKALALAVWDETPRERSDATQQFIALACAAALPLLQISTLRAAR